MALDTKLFINRLIEKEYTHLCVVPCSFAKFVINEAINNPNIEYLPCASEAVACSVAAGLKMAGKKPIVIVQSSGVTNMGSCITSLLKPYGVTFPILSSWRTYKYPDSEIQHQHLATELPQLIEAYGYENVILDNENIDNAIEQIELCDTTFTIAVIKKDSFTKVQLDEKHKLDLSNYTPRSEFLIALNNLFKNNDTFQFAYKSYNHKSLLLLSMVIKSGKYSGVQPFETFFPLNKPVFSPSVTHLSR